MKVTDGLWNWIQANWERALFAVLGMGFFLKCIELIIANKITDAAVVFGLGFLSFIFANVARFKRFKGLGFEAELWEDKQKEAADLIERLRDVVSIYSREAILGKVKAGRWGPVSNWKDRWALYDDLITRHNELGQKIDFSSLKKEIDDYFLFDMTSPEISKVREAVNKGMHAASLKIGQEFGSPIRDNEGYKKRIEQYRAIPSGFEDPFAISTKEDLADRTLTIWHDATERLKRDFDIDTDLAPELYERLQAISKLYQSRPVKVTDELINWADRNG